MTTENLDSVMRRIAKLMAIAQDDRANPAEAASAASMAEKIMRKYQLENADIVIAQLKAGTDMGEEDVYAQVTKRGKIKVFSVPQWCGQLAVAVAEANECGAKVWLMEDDNRSVRFYGFKADTLVAKYMMDYLVATVNRLCTAFKKSDIYVMEGQAGLNSYRVGCTAGIISKLNELTKAKQAEQEQSKSSTELMVCKAAAVAEHFGAMKTKAVARTVSRNNVYAQGVRDGKAINVQTKGVTGNVSNVLRLGN